MDKDTVYVLNKNSHPGFEMKCSDPATIVWALEAHICSSCTDVKRTGHLLNFKKAHNIPDDVVISFDLEVSCNPYVNGVAVEFEEGCYPTNDLLFGIDGREWDQLYMNYVYALPDDYDQLLSVHKIPHLMNTSCGAEFSYSELKPCPEKSNTWLHLVP